MEHLPYELPDQGRRILRVAQLLNKHELHSSIRALINIDVISETECLRMRQFEQHHYYHCGRMLLWGKNSLSRVDGPWLHVTGCPWVLYSLVNPPHASTPQFFFPARLFLCEDMLQFQGNSPWRKREPFKAK